MTFCKPNHSNLCG